MKPVVVRVEIARPVAEVFAFLEEVENNSREGSSFPITVTRQVEPLGDRSSLVTETLDSDPRGYYRIAEPLLRLLVQRRIRRDYQRLKALLEAGADRSAS